MTEVLTSIFAPIFVMLIAVMFMERFIYAILTASDFVVALMSDPITPVGRS
jgi:hypothetical protein